MKLFVPSGEMADNVARPWSQPHLSGL